MKPTIRKSVPITELRSYMEQWKKKAPGNVKIKTIGQSGGFDILAAVFTDSAVSDENKQHSLFTAQHAGMEISGMNVVLSLGNFLAAGSADAVEILKKHVVVLIPCPNCYSYSKQSTDYQFKNEFGVDEYTRFNYYSAVDAEKAPAASAIQALIDEFIPDMLIDCHGVWFENQMVAESFGYSFLATNRFYNTKLLNRIQAAATRRKLGAYDDDFPPSLVLADTSCNDSVIRARFRNTGNGVVSTVYSYTQYHTLAATLETGFEEIGLVRLVEALKAGCERGEFEYYPGYPTDTISEPWGHAAIRAYGNTAARRRAGRVELWKKRGEIAVGNVVPEMPGLMSIIVSCSKKMTEELVGEYYRYMPEVFENMRGRVDCDADKMIELYNGFYYSHAGILPDRGGECRVENGMTLRLMLPFDSAGIEGVFYNGYELERSDEYGYSVVNASGWTMVDLHIPPGKVADFAVGTVKYTCDVPKSGILEF